MTERPTAGVNRAARTLGAMEDPDKTARKHAGDDIEDIATGYGTGDALDLDSDDGERDAEGEEERA